MNPSETSTYLAFLSLLIDIGVRLGERERGGRGEEREGGRDEDSTHTLVQQHSYIHTCTSTCIGCQIGRARAQEKSVRALSEKGGGGR